jgi:hypothetical protein
MPRQRNLTTLGDAFKCLLKASRNREVVVWSKIGLHSKAAKYFHIAVTSKFTEKEHGLQLDPIFIENDGILSLNPNAHNVEDITILRSIDQAMSLLQKAEKQAIKKQMNKLTTREIYNYLKNRKEAAYIRHANKYNHAD